VSEVALAKVWSELSRRRPETWSIGRLHNHKPPYRSLIFRHAHCRCQTCKVPDAMDWPDDRLASLVDLMNLVARQLAAESLSSTAGRRQHLHSSGDARAGQRPSIRSSPVTCHSEQSWQPSATGFGSNRASPQTQSSSSQYRANFEKIPAPHWIPLTQGLLYLVKRDYLL